jgi:hypothetical protein
MAYSISAAWRRLCSSKRRDGKQCTAYAMWDPSAQGLCVQHAGRGHHGPQGVWNEAMGLYLPAPWDWRGKDHHAHYPPCRCAAYAWPHRPGGGLCRWPNAPVKTCPTPASTRSPYGKRRY